MSPTQPNAGGVWGPVRAWPGGGPGGRPPSGRPSGARPAPPPLDPEGAVPLWMAAVVRAAESPHARLRELAPEWGGFPCFFRPSVSPPWGESAGTPPPAVVIHSAPRATAARVRNP